jgi:hypothetical protein
MWWYGYGWWWWWIAFVIIFFLLPLGYGWGYRGWGPWYRRRRLPPTSSNARTAGDEQLRRELERRELEAGYGWGWGGIVLWIILLFAIAWLIAAWAWGGRY